MCVYCIWRAGVWRRKHGVLKYAMEFWHAHLADCGEGDGEAWDIAAEVFARDGNLRGSLGWVRLSGGDTKTEGFKHVVAYYGLERLVRQLVDRGEDPHLKDGQGRTAMSWALSRGHAKVVEVLMEKGTAAEDVCQTKYSLSVPRNRQR